MRAFDGRVAFVTGSATGLGRATALAFARAGARVVCADHNDEENAHTAALCAEAAGTAGGDASVAVAIHVDVTDDAQVRRGVAVAVERYGRLDCAFNNAGIEGSLAPVDDVSDDAWDRMLDVNLSGVWRCLRAEARVMRSQGAGAIVNCASILGTVGMANASAYTAAKHGVLGLTKAAALDLASAGVRVNAVCPGFIVTPMLERAGMLGDVETRAAIEALHPLGRLGDADEVAQAVLWLCSDAASFVTGHPLLVDGGFVAR